ncbi:MAG: hypothetical protein ABIA04_06530 [Pseudomonadota bacterium]
MLKRIIELQGTGTGKSFLFIPINTRDRFPTNSQLEEISNFHPDAVVSTDLNNTSDNVDSKKMQALQKLKATLIYLDHHGVPDEPWVKQWKFLANPNPIPDPANQPRWQRSNSAFVTKLFDLSESWQEEVGLRGDMGLARDSSNRQKAADMLNALGQAEKRGETEEQIAQRRVRLVQAISQAQSAEAFLKIMKTEYSDLFEYYQTIESDIKSNADLAFAKATEDTPKVTISSLQASIVLGKSISQDKTIIVHKIESGINIIDPVLKLTLSKLESSGQEATIIFIQELDNGRSVIYFLSTDRNHNNQDAPANCRTVALALGGGGHYHRSGTVVETKKADEVVRLAIGYFLGTKPLP